MDITFSTEQEQVRDTLREFLDSKDGIKPARRMMEGEADFEPLWNDLADLDYTSITVPLEYGGFGEGMTYLTSVLEVAGEVAMPGPYPETMAFVAPLVADVGTDAQCERFLSDIAAGESMWSFALYEEENEQLPQAIQMDGRKADDGYALDGVKRLVPYGGDVNEVVVGARTRDDDGYQGISLFVVNEADFEATKLRSLDRTRPMYELTFDEVQVDDDRLLGRFHEGGGPLRRAIDRYTVATMALLVGGASRAVERSAEYVNDRTQYGKPVGMFQAVKHRIADMWMDTEQGRWLTYYAAWALDTDAPDAGWAVSASAAFCGEQCPRIFKDDIWNHGGIGFTWDHDTHVYLKQAKTWENFLGNPQSHLDRVADTGWL